ncbi:DUF6503 family protein [Zobellia uliginosa]|uniref:DUF6503 family protein n=1 Tax=Zobellia uliginosa TaxID=143224 RepID=UPI0026E1A7BC|nr:DUF6503 family protein [Zobellia uliginosa]MDO6518365.1 DUF6503 family protein [Zobellia uliginosa]
MKRILTIVLILGLSSCKEVAKSEKKVGTDVKTEAVVANERYPEALVKVFDAHGGLKNWKSKRTLSFSLTKPKSVEVHTIDLYSRRDKVEIPPVTMGFDGDAVWLLDEQGSYKGNPALYHNLMFYFYAMPFVFSDSGINYKPADDLVYEGKSYPGIHISYNDGVGASSKDDYYLHYDPETYKMAWLGYTFTFGSNEKSKNVRWIHYNDWIDVEGVQLPKSITWHNYEGRTIKEAKEPTVFENISLQETSRPDSFYAKPENAKVVLKD